MNTVIQSAMDFITYKKTITNPGADIISAKIEQLTIEQGVARLYGEDSLNYGELKTIDDTGQTKNFFFVLASLEV